MDKEILMDSFEPWSMLMDYIKAAGELSLNLVYTHPYLVRAIGILRESFVSGEDEAWSEEFKAVRNYRMYAGNCLLELFSYLRQENQKAAEELLVSMIHSAIPAVPPVTDMKYKAYLHVFESFVFFAHSLLDEFQIESAAIPYFIDTFKLIFNTQPNSTLGSTSLLFIQDGARQFNFVPSLIPPAVDYSLYIAATFPLLQTLACKTIREVIEICRANVPADQIPKIEKSLMLGDLNPEAAGALSSAMGAFHCNTRKVNAESLLGWAEEELKRGVEGKRLLCVLSSLHQYVATLARVELTLEETSKALSANAPTIMQLLYKLAEASKEPLRREVIKEIVGIFIGLLKTVKLSEEAKSASAQVMLGVWTADISQIELLRVLAMLSKSSHSLPMRDKVCAHFLASYQGLGKDQLILTVHSMANYLQETLLDDSFITSKSIELTLSIFCQFISSDYEQDVNASILFLFKAIIETPSSAVRKASLELLKHNLLLAAMLSLPFELHNLMLLSELLVSSMTFSPAVTNSAIGAALTSPKFQAVPEEGKRVFVEFVNKFGGDRRKVKEIVKVVHKLLNSFCSADELMRFQKQVEMLNNDTFNVITIE